MTGNFGIHLDEIQTPPNDHYGAASLLVDRSKMNLGTTLNASIGSDFQCGAGGQVGVNNEAPGVWYTALGNGQTFELTTCASETDFDTAIQVFVGDCSQLRCVTRAGTDIDRNCSSSHSSRLSFDTVKGQLYYIYVFGRTSGDTGKFGFMLF